jgi:hypothetical protein
LVSQGNKTKRGYYVKGNSFLILFIYLIFIIFQIKRETGMVTREIDKASSLHQKLKQQNEEFRVPEVLDYVHLKAELYEIDKKVQDWERKVLSPLPLSPPFGFFLLSFLY